MAKRKVVGYGWLKDHLDARDRRLSLAPRTAPLPSSVDMRAQCPPVYDQQDLGSCTANAIAAAVDFERQKQGEPLLTPSRLFIYYCERDIEGTTGSDSGAEIRDGIKVVAAQGVCPESEWPYDVSQFAVKPSAQSYTDAVKVEALGYSRVDQSVEAIQAVLAGGHPVVFGFSVYDAFESAQVAQTGVVQMPEPGAAPIGGHAVLAVGYDSAAQQFIARNSWGPDWGLKGYFLMPFAYLVDPNLASDLWVISKET